MKFSTGLVLTLVGLILFGVFYDNKRIPHLAGSTPSTAAPSTAPPPPTAQFTAPQPVTARATATPQATSPSSSSPSSSSPSSSSSSLLSTIRSLLKSASTSTGSSPVATDASQSPDTKTPVPIDQLLIARGIVARKTEAGLLLECSNPLIDKSNTLGATNVKGSVRQIRIIMENEERRYGPVTSVRDGIVQPAHLDLSQWTPDKYVHGLVLLVGYPADTIYSGEAMNVLVAPATPITWNGAAYQTVTATFTVAPAAPGSWMWHKGVGTDSESR